MGGHDDPEKDTVDPALADNVPPQPRGRLPGRRARTAAPPGTDPAPAPEAPRHRDADNDDRLRREKPPHY